jgi:hypothetical protein
MSRGFNWEAAGRETGTRLGAYHAIVVIGADPVSTGRVAVGIGRTQSEYRRVAVGDLFAESWPIQELVQSDDPHGLVDSFLYGVSLSRIAHEVPGTGQLFVMPSGTEPPNYEEILPSPRWQRLAAGFREVNALLVLAAPARAPHIEALANSMDGAILVGEVIPAGLSATRVIESVRESVAAVKELPKPAPARQSNARTSTSKTTKSPKSRARVSAAIGVVLTVVIAGLSAWLAYRPMARPHLGPWQRDTASTMLPMLSPTPDSAFDTTTPATAPPPVPRVLNPADSVNAAAFAIELVVMNTQPGAILKLQQQHADLPAATFSPTIVPGGVEWYEFVSGAFADRASADSLLADLGRRRLLGDGAKVVHRPFAFLVDSVTTTAAAPEAVAGYVERGQPVYALRQTNGHVWLLMGAFETPEQASLNIESLRASGIQPVLVYRKGRSF